MERRVVLGLMVLVALGGVSAAPAGAAGRVDVRHVAPHPVILILVVDRSGSMSGEKIVAARQGCEAAVRLLKPSDQVALIIFDSQPVRLLALQPVGSGEAARQAIGRIVAQGGTGFLPALRMVSREVGSRAAPRQARRHVIFVSDGQSSWGGVLQEVTHLRKLGFTLSTLALGPEADQQFLTRMGSAGSGRFYGLATAGSLARVMEKELALRGR